MSQQSRAGRRPPPRRQATTLAGLRDLVAEAVGDVVVGQEAAVDALVGALAVGGHVLLEGVPGVAKTLLANATAAALGLDFGRVQFTPDLLPSDVTGSMTLRGGDLVFRAGPIFANIVLADEINRTPPKTQSALLEAMQEGQVTVDGQPYALPEPFMVVATQNPVEYEGTYPLPEAQLDRFVVKVEVDYPSEADERSMLGLARQGVRPADASDVAVVAGPDDIAAVRAEVDSTTVTDEVAAYVVALVRATRALPSVELGASPRAAVHLQAMARTAARLAGRDFVTPDDVVAVAPSVLHHRLVMQPEAELERVTADDAVRAAVASVAVPR